MSKAAISTQPDRFGFAAILLHWLIAIATIGLFAVGWYMVELTYYDPLYQTLPHVHKSVGLLLAIVLLAGIVRKVFGRGPAPVSGSSPLIVLGSRIAHWLMWLMITFIILSGYLISTAQGVAIDVFSWFSVPATITAIPEQEDLTGQIHKYLAYALVALVAVHMAAALKHHFVNKDQTLRRMLGL